MGVELLDWRAGMNTPGRSRFLLGGLLVFLFILFAAGCGGGGDAPADSSGNNPPPTEPAPSPDTVIADAGRIIAVRVTDTATLNGTESSTTLPDPLTYEWSFTHKPDGSTAALDDPTSPQPSFVADIEGTYMVQLVVSSGNVTSRRAIGFVEVTTSGNVTGKRVHTRYTSNCSECHDGRFEDPEPPFDPITGKSPNHIATTNMCAACHTTFGFNLPLFVDHQELFGNCSSCHDGVIAVGKSDLHIETNAECDNCHTTTSFVDVALDGSFDHTGVTSGCYRCHNGTIATGQVDTAIHNNTTSDCSACHVTTGFLPAFVDHTTVGSDCSTCHNNIDAVGPIAGHPLTTPPVECGTCHNTTSFNMGGIFNHRVVDSVTLPCSTCHVDPNGINAPFKPVTHIPTTFDCGSCHNVTTFLGTTIDHSDPAVAAQACSNCHGDAAPPSVAPRKHATHLPTTRECNACHTTGGTFATGTFDHGIETNGVSCESCHNEHNDPINSVSIGKPFDHIPTAQDCNACHTTTTFIGAVFNHTGITNGCTTCHDGTIATGKIANHIPTTPIDQDCVDCHAASLATFTDFTGGVFAHLGVTNNCATCHDGSYVTSGAIGKIPNHIPALGECSQCHIDTTVPGGFASSIFMTDVHPGLATGCEGCHKDQFLLNNIPQAVKAATHLPTSQDCHFCHTNVAFTPQIFTHDGITGNCVSCHNGNYFALANAMGKLDGPSQSHPTTTDDCAQCHGIGGNFMDGSSFDHTGRVDNCNECHADGATGAVTKKNAAHLPTTEDCSVCHVPGSFATAVFNHVGIVDNCTQCHDGSYATTVKPPFPQHITTSEDCSVCHNTTAFAGARFDHTNVTENCASCHNGVTAMGKHGTHVPTSEDCSVCHQTTGFIPATFSHTGIVDNCASCHDGAISRGKPGGHILTSDDCGLCHTTRGFIPSTFDHSTITASTRCDSCHGVTATGKDDAPTPHLPTTLDCRNCHTTATFVGGTWVHDASTAGVCDTCHTTNGGARAKPTGHIPTTLQCDQCHTTNGWAPVNFTHDPQGDYPGDHARAPLCSACHGNTISLPFDYPFNQYAPFCAACHANDFERQDDHNGGNNGTVEQNKDCSGGGRGCHRVTDTKFD
jgi:hypothetical protein